MTIKQVLSTARVPVKIWTDAVEDAAKTQLLNTAALPFVFKHVAAMPDVHLGKGATVGSVVATKGAIVPAAVGVDIGCGMMAVQLPLTLDQIQPKLAELRHAIERVVPTGHEGNRTITATAQAWAGWQEWSRLTAKANLERALSQLGTLGGGNHFIEVCGDEAGQVWVMLHSGSRNVGKVLAEQHIDRAKGVMRQMFIDLPDPDLAYFAAGTAEFTAYMHDLAWAQAYALANREEMMRRVLRELAYYFNAGQPLDLLMEINCHHNYVALENHYGENVYVTRKGAVRARTDDLGIIPGSMGAKSYIVRGKGVAESFCSCSHGAGRRMSRTQARREFNLADLAAQTDGVECRKDDSVLDEIPGSYKDIDVVMANQSDLVDVVAVLKQVLCVKGG